MNPRILIEIFGGCVSGITTDGAVDVFVQDHDNRDRQPIPSAPDEVLPRDEFNRRLRPVPAPTAPGL